MRPARHKGYLIPGGRKPAPEIAAHTARANHDYLHMQPVQLALYEGMTNLDPKRREESSSSSDMPKFKEISAN